MPVGKRVDRSRAPHTREHYLAIKKSEASRWAGPRGHVLSDMTWSRKTNTIRSHLQMATEAYTVETKEKLHEDLK